MQSGADIATGSVSDEGWRLRLGMAFALSVACHALLLLAVRDWREEGRPAPPLIVTMVERGGPEDGDSSGSGEPRTPPAAPAAPVAAIAAPVQAPAVRDRPSTFARRSRPSSPVTAPVAAALDDHGAVEATTGAETSANGGDREAGTDDAVGTGGHRTSGAGADGGSSPGSGGGSDGLRAFCASCPTPEYPPRARRQGWQGTVDVELAIGRDGGVAEARVDRSSGYPTLDEVALGVARRSRFSVPTAGDGLRGQLRYRFVLDATAVQR